MQASFFFFKSTSFQSVLLNFTVEFHTHKKKNLIKVTPLGYTQTERPRQTSAPRGLGSGGRRSVLRACQRLDPLELQSLVEVDVQHSGSFGQLQVADAALEGRAGGQAELLQARCNEAWKPGWDSATITPLSRPASETILSMLAYSRSSNSTHLQRTASKRFAIIWGQSVIYFNCQ